MDYFRENLLTLNMTKSGCMAVGGGGGNKSTVMLNCGTLHYEPRQTSLGAILADSDKLKQDVDKHITCKQPSIAIKLTDFIRCTAGMGHTENHEILYKCIFTIWM